MSDAPEAKAGPKPPRRPTREVRDDFVSSKESQ